MQLGYWRASIRASSSLRVFGHGRYFELPPSGEGVRDSALGLPESKQTSSNSNGMVSKVEGSRLFLSAPVLGMVVSAVDGSVDTSTVDGTMSSSPCVKTWLKRGSSKAWVVFTPFQRRSLINRRRINVKASRIIILVLHLGTRGPFCFLF